LSLDMTSLGVYLKRSCSRVTSASSALGVLNDYALYKSTHALAVWQSLNSQPIDRPRRVAFSEQVQVYSLCSSPQRVYILRGARRRCVWAVGRLGVAACVAAATAATSRRTPTQTRHRTHRSGGRADSVHTATPDTTKKSCLCCVLLCLCVLDNCYLRVQTSNFPSATVLSCRESNSRRRGRHDTDRTVLSCLVWRCELGIHSVKVT